VQHTGPAPQYGVNRVIVRGLKASAGGKIQFAPEMSQPRTGLHGVQCRHRQGAAIGTCYAKLLAVRGQRRHSLDIGG
jgi:hypothetical protein